MQILSITCDNAMNNDKMIDELELLLEDFPGAANRARLRWVRVSFSYNIIFLIHSLVLHPHHKLHYFEKAGWEADWIRSAETILRDEYDRTYRFRETAATAEEPMV